MNMPNSRRPVFDRFWEKVDTSGGPDACWPWTGCVTAAGYGKFRIARDEPNRSAHQLAYMTAYGPVAPRTHIGHICHDRDLSCVLGPDCPHRRCCNPAHLEAITPLMNSRRGHPRPNWTDPDGSHRVQIRTHVEAHTAQALRNWADRQRMAPNDVVRKALDDFAQRCAGAA